MLKKACSPRSVANLLTTDPNAGMFSSMSEKKFFLHRVRAFARYLAQYHPSAFLLLAQLLSLVLYAAFEGVPSGRFLLVAFGTLVLVLVVWVVVRSPALNWISWLLAIPAIVLSLVAAFDENQAVSIWVAVLEAALYFYAAGGLIAYMMKDDRVSFDDFFAAGATFTLLAWGFAYLYIICQAFLPTSFSGGTLPGKYRSFLELLFFSFSNLSATGLSDILPVTSPGRVIVMLEQFAGVAYIAVVVSRLIGLSIVGRKDGRRQ